MEPTKLTPYQLERNRLKFTLYFFVLLFAALLNIFSCIFATHLCSFIGWLPSSGDGSMGLAFALAFCIPIISVIQLISIVANVFFISLAHKNVIFEFKIVINAIIMSIFAYFMAEGSDFAYYKTFVFLLVFPLIPLIAADLFLTKLVNQALLKPESSNSMHQTVAGETGIVRTD